MPFEAGEEPDNSTEEAPAEPASAAPLPKSLRCILLAAIVLFGVALRLWGITWGLPDQRHPLASYHPDELVNLDALRQINVLGGKLDIGYYNYGTLYFYLADIAQDVGHGYHAIPSTPLNSLASPPPTPMGYAERQMPETRGIVLAGRLVSAIAGTLTIPVLFAFGRRLFGERVGLTAALLYAVLPLSAVHAHFFTVDVTATLFVTLALLWAARLLESRSTKELVVAGIWVGLAAATKYSCVLVAAAPIAAWLLATPKTEGKRRQPVPLLLLLGAAVVAFLMACPGPLINWDAFWNGLPQWPGSGVRYELFEHPRAGHGLLFVNTGPGWWYHFVVSLRYGLGVPMLVLVVTGLASALTAKTKQDRMLLWFLLVFYGITGLSGVRFARYMIPLYPALCVLAARRVWEVKPRTIRHHAVPLALALLVLLTAAYTVSLVHAMAVKDPRDAAADFLETNAPQGASVAFAKTPWYFSPPLSRWFGAKSAVMRAKCVESTRFRFILPGLVGASETDRAEFDISVLTPPPDYIVISNIETVNELRLHIPGAEAFMKALPHDYHQHEFAPPALFDMAFTTDLVPDDLLYILPKETVYSRR